MTEIERAREIISQQMHPRDKGFCDKVLAGERDDCPEMRIVLAALRTADADMRATIAAQAKVIEAADDLVNGGGLVLTLPSGPRLCVIEKPDNSDAHARLCDALEALAALDQDKPDAD